MRTIDANALKKAISNRAQNILEIRLDGKCFFTLDEILHLIDNATTVNPCNNCDLYFIAKTKEEMQKGGKK